MAGKLFNLARMTTATTGTGTITLGSAVSGFLTFAQAGVANGDVVSYAIADGANSEVGTGTYTTSGTTLTRTVLASTNSGSAINLSGNAQVIITALKEDIVTSVFGRAAPAIVAAAGDYDITQIYKNKMFGGRLTLTTATPVLTANTTAQGTVFYAIYAHDLVSIYDGTRFVAYQFTEMSVVLDATNFLSTKLYDFFVFNDSGTLRLGYGPAWTNNTTRSGAISRIQGIWTNTSTMTIRYSSSNTVSVPANQASYVGTVRATANAQTGWNPRPTPADGGAAPTINVFNAYNRVPVSAQNLDTNTAGWTYATNVWRVGHSNTNNVIGFIDGLGEVYALANSMCCFENASNGTVQMATIGIHLNATTGAPTIISFWESEIDSTHFTEITSPCFGRFYPALGWNTVTPMEICNQGGVILFNLAINLDIDL